MVARSGAISKDILLGLCSGGAHGGWGEGGVLIDHGQQGPGNNLARVRPLGSLAGRPAAACPDLFSFSFFPAVRCQSAFPKIPGRRSSGMQIMRGNGRAQPPPPTPPSQTPKLPSTESSSSSIIIQTLTFRPRVMYQAKQHESAREGNQLRVLTSPPSPRCLDVVLRYSSVPRGVSVAGQARPCLELLRTVICRVGSTMGRYCVAQPGLIDRRPSMPHPAVASCGPHTLSHWVVYA